MDSPAQRLELFAPWSSSRNFLEREKKKNGQREALAGKLQPGLWKKKEEKEKKEHNYRDNEKP